MNNINLNAKERAVLAAVELNAERTVSEISKITKLPAYTVSYIIARLRRLGILGSVRPMVDVAPLGFDNYTFFFALDSRRTPDRRRALEFLHNYPGITWIAEVGGRFQFCAALLAPSTHYVQKFLNAFAEKSGSQILSKEMSVRLSIESYGRGYLSAIAQKTAPLVLGGEVNEVSIDELDRKILSGLCNSDSQSLRDLSRLLSTPLSTIERRVKALEQSGIIRGWYYGFHGIKIGIQVLSILVHTRGLSRTFASKIRDFSRKHPRIVHLVSCIGPWEYEVVCECENSAAISDITAELYEVCGDGIEHIEVLPTLQYLKYSAYPFNDVN